MKKSRILILAFGAFALVLVVGAIVLASVPFAPHAQTTEKLIPDDKIPH